VRPPYVTIGCDFLTKDVVVNDTTVTIQAWDTGGAERFGEMGSSFYRGAYICMLVFDVTSAKSFKKIEEWKENCLSSCSPNFLPSFVVVGNKIDLPNREVTTEAAQEWCKKNGDMPYIETSVKTLTNVEEAFYVGVKTELESRLPQEPDLSFVPIDQPDKTTPSTLWWKIIPLCFVVGGIVYALRYA